MIITFELCLLKVNAALYPSPQPILDVPDAGSPYSSLAIVSIKHNRAIHILSSYGKHIFPTKKNARLKNRFTEHQLIRITARSLVRYLRLSGQQFGQ